MNAQKLYTKKDGVEKQVAWYCSNCGTVHKQQEEAEKCCKPLICEKCGKEISQDRNKHYFEAYFINPVRCSDCYQKDKWNQMETLTEEEYYKLREEDKSFGPVFWGDTGYETLEDALECELSEYDSIEDIPDEIELGQWEKMKPIQIEDIIYNEIENCMFEDGVEAERCYTDVDELFTFVKEWNKKQNSYVYYTGINKKLKINPETIKEYYN